MAAAAATTAKEVQADLSPLIKLYTDGTVERIWSSPYTPPPSPANPTISGKDTAISPSISARLYLPKNLPRKLPVLVYYHAGAFCLGSAFSSLDHRYIAALSASAGALVVSVEYRLAPEHPLPAAYLDSWEALKWVCSEKDKWISDHGDLSRLFVAGDSAGGNIAHYVALRAGSEALPGNLKIEGAILVHPYFWGSNPIGNETKEDVEKSLAYRLWLFSYPSAPGGIDSPLMNPLADGARSLSELACSRMIVCLAEKDELKGRGLVYAEGVRRSGWKGEIEVVVVEGEDHCFQLLDPESEKAKSLIERLAAFISR